MEGLTFGAIDSLTSSVTGRPVPYSPFGAQAYLPTMWDRMAMPGGWAGAYNPAIYQQIGAPYMASPYFTGAGAGVYQPGISQGNPALYTGAYNPVMGGAVPVGLGTQTGMPSGVPFNPMMAYSTNAAVAATATAQMGFMPSGNSSLDLANSIVNAPA